ncbi:hypothetical protein CRG98_002133 [Punica granatum]|uniref:Uncharacterized protein n=1 Tax=Punica granatum TaxID=22663 RepID=A0A2I0LA21_PUNGR|nr:hypothetical protein CRG98_002133 [Punica granatum]
MGHLAVSLPRRLDFQLRAKKEVVMFVEGAEEEVKEMMMVAVMERGGGDGDGCDVVRKEGAKECSEERRRWLRQ